MSVILTLALLVLAQYLAWRLKQAGALPGQNESPAVVRSRSWSRAPVAPLRARRWWPSWSWAEGVEQGTAGNETFEL